MRSLLLLCLSVLSLSTALKCYVGVDNTRDTWECPGSYCRKEVDALRAVKKCDNNNECRSETCSAGSAGSITCCCKGDLCNPASTPLVLLPLAAVAALIAARI
ncbi:hypothetical protein PENTCL1PPCAC_5124 [Pristionchus entomophagus]|uniref:Activin types I and II receptor domain-containing protein n=1 Tax=Pristionchus entomophagus TaxID=358040 RepID=A0AAV5SNQ3_9BILA|nr:hypothetical protein PENTCL1PPCAC_5124 [Pristionchus entomophagus]